MHRAAPTLLALTVALLVAAAPAGAARKLPRHFLWGVASSRFRRRGTPRGFAPAERPDAANCATASVAPPDRATCLAAAR